ncbi:hypothetical protein [Amycolatopsis roodepoortensis]|uniref:hypothetical protein n=1 Tax=Amycolatopsis roodepoortensis TaxID=700274 RepID=UPI0027D8F960|nr:hypothetical protein [Amycolatopsis roodepoortensis]
MSYCQTPFIDQVGILRAEIAHTRPRLHAAKKMWTDAERWIDRTHMMLRDAADAVSSGWLDRPGEEFVDRLRANCLYSFGSWGGLEGSKDTKLPSFAGTLFGQPVDGGITASGVITQLDMADAQLVVGAFVAAGEISKVEQNADYTPQAQENLGRKLDEIATQYRVTAQAMLAARGRPWDGPSAEAGSGLPDNGSVPSAAGTGGPNQNGAPVDPGTPEVPGEPSPQNPQEDPSALEQASNALSALSQAAESAQQLLGNGSSVNLPDPNAIDPADWTLPPYDGSAYPGLEDPLGAPGGSGMPSLAGSGGLPGSGGGMGGLGGMPAIPDLNGSPGGAAAGVGSMPGIASAGTAGSSGSASGAGGMPPPMVPPNGGGKNSPSGIKPGDAEYTGSSRQRGPKGGGTPGVTLLGRSRGGGTRPATAQRRWDTENDTVQLLDDELWQVQETTDSHGKPAKYRAGH